jgi:hypothetical protein
MQYRGYTYIEDIQEEDDNRKIFHEIQREDGSMVEWSRIPREFIQLSPYRSATKEQFEKAVDEVIFHDFISENTG